MPTFKVTLAELVPDEKEKSGYSYFIEEEKLIADRPGDVTAYARGLRIDGTANGFGRYVLYAEEIANNKNGGNKITINFYEELPEVAKDIYNMSVIETR